MPHGISCLPYWQSLLAKWEVTFPSLHSEKSPLSSQNLNQEHFTALLKKPPGAFGVAFWGWLRERERSKEQKKKSPVSCTLCNSSCIEAATRIWRGRTVPAGDGFLRTAKHRRAGNRKLLRTLSTSHVTQPGVTDVAGVRLWLCLQGQRQIPVSTPSTGVREGSPGWGESHWQTSSLAIPNIESLRKLIRQPRHLQVGQAIGCKCPL